MQTSAQAPDALTLPKAWLIGRTIGTLGSDESLLLAFLCAAPLLFLQLCHSALRHLSGSVKSGGGVRVVSMRACARARVHRFFCTSSMRSAPPPSFPRE